MKKTETYGQFIKSAAKLIGHDLSKDERLFLIESLAQIWRKRSEDQALSDYVRKVLAGAAERIEKIATAAENLALCPEPNPKWRTEWDRSANGFELSKMVRDISYSRLNGVTKAVLRALADRHNSDVDFSKKPYSKNPAKSTIYACNDDIGDDAGCEEKAVRRATAVLQDMHYIHLLHGGESSNSTNFWVLNVAGIRKLAEESRAEREQAKRKKRGSGAMPSQDSESGLDSGSQDSESGGSGLKVRTVPPISPDGQDSESGEQISEANKKTNHTTDVTAAPSVVVVQDLFRKKRTDRSPRLSDKFKAQLEVQLTSFGPSFDDVSAALDVFIQEEPWKEMEAKSGKPTTMPLYLFVENFPRYLNSVAASRQSEAQREADERAVAASRAQFALLNTPSPKTESVEGEEPWL